MSVVTQKTKPTEIPITPFVLKGFLIKAVHMHSEAIGIKSFEDDDRAGSAKIRLDKHLHKIPKRFLNRIANIRTSTYNTLIKNSGAIPVQKIGKHTLWLVPPDIVPKLEAQFEEHVRKELRVVEKLINDWIENPTDADKKLITAYMKAKFNEELKIIMPKLAEDAWIEYSTVGLTFEQWKDYLADREKKQLIKLDEKEHAAIEHMEQRMKQQEKDLMLNAAKHFQDRLTEIFNKLTPELARENAGDLRSGLAETKELMENCGVSTALSHQFDRTNNIVEAYITQDPDKILVAAQTLREDLGLGEELNPDQVLKHAYRMLNKDLDPRTKAMLIQTEIEA